MSRVDNEEYYTGWVWATTASAVASWGIAIGLVVVDAIDDLPNPIVGAVISAAICVTGVSGMLRLARWGWRIDHAIRTMSRPMIAATTIEMPRIAARGRVPAAVVGAGAAAWSSSREHPVLGEADKTRRLKRSEYYELYSDVLNDLGTLSTPLDDDEADDR